MIPRPIDVPRRAGPALLAALCLLTACSSPGPVPPRELAGAEPQAYVIGIPDLLRITVWKHDDLQVQAPVRSDGKISVPLLDDVQAAGLTPEQLKDVITRQLSEFLKSPDVTVIVVSPDSQKVTVLGAVLRSGPIALTHEMGVFEAVAAAGGFNAWANKGDVRLIRTDAGERVSYKLSYRDYVRGKPDSDIRLRPGDVVLVRE